MVLLVCEATPYTSRYLGASLRRLPYNNSLFTMPINSITS
nr:MAG TPA: hypothetical protein [Caudoviricetes sp.]